MSDRNIPDDWIPLSSMEAEGNPDGGLFLDPTGSGLTFIGYHEDRENDLIRLYDSEVSHLIHRLVDYLADK